MKEAVQCIIGQYCKDFLVVLFVEYIFLLLSFFLDKKRSCWIYYICMNTKKCFTRRNILWYILYRPWQIHSKRQTLKVGGMCMGINVKCPKCGGAHVQLSNEASKHGCLWTILFGFCYLWWVIIKWMIGMCVFLFYDWWMAIIHVASGKGHVWQAKKWFSNRKKIYYCHDCGHNFRA